MAERQPRDGPRAGGDPVVDAEPTAASAAPELRQLPVELIAPEPAPAAARFDEEALLALAELAAASAACCSRCSSARCPAAPTS